MLVAVEVRALVVAEVPMLVAVELAAIAVLAAVDGEVVLELEALHWPNCGWHPVPQ